MLAETLLFAASSLKVAFFGDSTLNERSRAVFRLVREEGAEAVVHLGDFDYHHDPEGWERRIDEELGADFPFFAVIGNHDRADWPAYQEHLRRRAERVGAVCTGDLGVRSACRYRGLLLILSGAGVHGTDHEAFIREELAEADDTWRICAWHKNQRLLQPAGKRDEVGWGPYEACREGGAFVVNGHAHVYSRTHLLRRFETQEVASTSNDLVLDGERSFVVVSGLGGRRTDRQQIDGGWLAVARTKSQHAAHGALFCTFVPTGTADCYFKDLTGTTEDRFRVLVEPVPVAGTVPENSTLPPHE